jgi:hypothetical protein
MREHQLADVVQHAGEERRRRPVAVHCLGDRDAVRGGRRAHAVLPQRFHAEAFDFGGVAVGEDALPSTSAMMRSRPSRAPARATSATGFCRPKYAEFTSLSRRAVIAGSVAITSPRLRCWSSAICRASTSFW